MVRAAPLAQTAGNLWEEEEEGESTGRWVARAAPLVETNNAEEQVAPPIEFRWRVKT